MGCGASAAPKKDDTAQQENVKFLLTVDLFKRLPESEIPLLGKHCTQIVLDPGQVIIKQGEMGEEFYIIKTGTAKVEVGGTLVATLKKGSFFGENALLRDEPRTATITAQTKIEALKITRKEFSSLGLKEKLDFGKRGAVAGGAASDAMVKDPSPKTVDERANMSKALKKNKNLNHLISLDDQKINELIDLMWRENVSEGIEIITEGDLSADYFYIVQEGNFEVKKKPEGTGIDKEVGQHASVAILEQGSSFGELALLYFTPRAATIVAQTNAVVWVLARQQFKMVLQKGSSDSAGEYVKMLDKVDILAPLKDLEKKRLAEALDDFVFDMGECIFEQGEKGVLFYILTEGEVAVIKDGKEEAILKGSVDKAVYFGERALLTDEPRAATIKVVSATAVTLAVDKITFDVLLGPLDELKKRGKDGIDTVRKSMLGNTEERKFGLIKRSELKKLGLLGCGGFGAVEMVEHTKTGDLYALKALSKGYVVKTGMQKSVMSEKDVQIMCDSHFIVKIFETYNGEQSLYFLLELALGGELYATYNKKGLWGSVSCARFYVAGVVYAFEHMHSKKIVFRDLKPENLLLNTKGMVKLTDMGLAKVVLGKTFTTCGTPDYFAPEIITSKGHNKAVDWWTVGILNYELLAGHPPFESHSPMQIYEKVKKGINKVNFPKACQGKVESLIKGNCNANPAERLPMKKGGIENIQHHPWFSGFNWQEFYDLKMDPPYKPVVKDKKDKGNFSANKDDMPPQINYTDPGTGWDKGFATST